MLGNHGLPIRANPILNNIPVNFVQPPAVIPVTRPPVVQPVLGVYKFLSRNTCDIPIPMTIATSVSLPPAASSCTRHRVAVVVKDFLQDLLELHR